MESLKQIIEIHNKEVVFPLFDTTFTVPAERNIYNEMRKKYQGLASDATWKFLEYNEKFVDYYDLVKTASEKFADSMSEILTEVCQDALSMGVTTLSPMNLADECYKDFYFKPFISALEKFKVRITPNKSSSSSGDFTAVIPINTISDAIGYTIGSAMADAIEEMIDEESIESERRKLFKNESLRSELVGSIDRCCNHIINNVMYIISKKGSLGLKGWPGDSDSNKAETLLENLQKLKLPIEQQREFALEILSLDPYLREPYIECLRKFSDSDLQVIAIADFFRISGMREKAKTVLVDFVNNSIGTTEEDAHKCREMLKFKTDKLELSKEECQEANNVIDERLKKLDLEYRTVDGVVLATRDLADLARKELAEIKRIGDAVETSMQNNPSTPDDLLKCEREISGYKNQLEAFTTDVKNKYLEICDNYLSRIDLEYRTVDGIVLDTRESADATRKDVVTYKDILEKPHVNFVFKSDYLSHMEEIRQLPVAEQLKDKYIKIYHSHLADLEKKYKIAARHEYYRKHKNPVWNGDVGNMLKHIAVLALSIIFIVSRVRADWDESAFFIVAGSIVWGGIGTAYWVFKMKKEKKVWNEVTHDGKYDFDDIISETKNVRY